MTRINKIKVFSFAKFQAFLGLLIGLICGIIYSFGGLIIDVLVSYELLSSAAMSTPGLSYGTLLAFWALIGMPIICSIAGFLLGLVEAVLYNLFARWFGGIEVNFDK